MAFLSVVHMGHGKLYRSRQIRFVWRNAFYLHGTSSMFMAQFLSSKQTFYGMMEWSDPAPQENAYSFAGEFAYHCGDNS